MVVVSVLYLLAAVGSACDQTGHADTIVGAIQDDFSQLVELSAEDQQLEPVTGAFRRLFDTHRTCLESLVIAEDLTESDLQDLFHLTSRFVIETGADGSLDLARMVAEQLEQRFDRGEDYAEWYYDFLTGLRQFDQAERFATFWPDADFATIPLILSQPAPLIGKRALYAESLDGSALREEHVDMSGYTGVIMVGHPRCHFSANAMTAIEGDPELAVSLAEHGLFITDTWSRLGDEAVVAWNRENPRFAYRHPADKFAWPEVSYWGTPSFYFVREGEVVRKVVGWPKDESEERKAALREGLRAARLMDRSFPE